MNRQEIVDKIASGEWSAEQEIAALRSLMEADLGFAKVDKDRLKRRGIPETVFSPGKTPKQIVGIMGTLKAAGQNAMATRASREVYEAIAADHPGAVYHEDARIVTLDVIDLPEETGQVAIVSAGTADIPVAEEAALVAERMGSRVVRVFDVGVAGLHRVTNHVDTLRRSRVVVVVAGMEGALPSVVAGLIDRPVIAVPTSVGYSLNFKGLAALLAMLNTCVPGITVVNVDNGFGAGVAAAMINKTGEMEKWSNGILE